MEKLISFFQSDKRKTAKFEEEDEERIETPNGRRKLSISRSGRLKQANKKRHNITVDLYGETNAPVERPTSLEYHVNSPAPQPPQNKPEQKKSSDSSTPSDPKSPEEEIESAFEILDKVDKGT